MKNILFILLTGQFVFGQALISTESPEAVSSSDIAGNAVLEVVGDGTQAIRFPHIANGTSLTNATAGMLVYREDQNCFSFHDGTSFSSCLEDVKTESLSSNTYDTPSTQNVTSSTWVNFPLLTGSNTFEVPYQEAAVVLKVRSQHNIVNDFGPSSFKCGSGDIGIFVDGTLVESLTHTYPATSSGRIFPVELYSILQLTQGSHTVNIRYRNNDSNCRLTDNTGNTTAPTNRYNGPTLAITIKEI